MSVRSPARPRPGENIQLVESANGAFVYRAKVSAQVAGRRVEQRSTHRTLKAAREWQSIARTALLTNATTPHKSPTVDEVVRAYLATRRVRTQTMRGYLTAAKRIQDAPIGLTPVNTLQEAQVEEWVSSLADKGLARASVQQSLHLLKAALDRAVRQDFARRNVASYVRATGRYRPDTTSFTAEEWQRLGASLANLPQPWQAALTLSLMGLRRSEVMGLRWRHVDLEARSLNIEKSRTGDEVNDTKTKRGFRRLPLSPAHVLTLQRLRQAQLDAHPVTAETFLVTVLQRHPRMRRSIGEPVAPERMEAWWTTLCRQAGVPESPLKTARSSSVTLMREQGIPDLVVAAWHGHTEAVMRDNYTAPVSFEDLNRYQAPAAPSTE